MKQHSPAIHHTIVVTDTESFTDPARTNLDQLAVRHGLYKIIRAAFVRACIDWHACRTEDRGDGVLILIPPNVPKVQLATRMLAQLETALRRHNASCTAQTRIRLRISLHAGEVHYDSHGVAGKSINHAFRLAESPVFKTAHAASPCLLAIIVSDWFFDEVIRHYPAAKPSSYHRARAAIQGSEAPAWIRLPGHVEPNQHATGWP